MNAIDKCLKASGKLGESFGVKVAFGDVALLKLFLSELKSTHEGTVSS